MASCSDCGAVPTPSWSGRRSCANRVRVERRGVTAMCAFWRARRGRGRSERHETSDGGKQAFSDMGGSGIRGLQSA
jgi:hypothetical protein